MDEGSSPTSGARLSSHKEQAKIILLEMDHFVIEISINHAKYCKVYIAI